MTAKIVRFITHIDTRNGLIFGKVIEGEHKDKICFLPDWCNNKGIGKIGEGFVKRDEGNYFVLMGVDFEEN